MNDKLLAPYNPQNTEQRIYTAWEESGFFNPDTCIEKGITDQNAEPFSMVLPPPNVTGTLHTGHALMLVIQDIMARYARMQGKRTLWLPGTDHAAIATQSKVEKILEKEEGKRKQDLGREEFLKRVEAFAQDSHDTIVSQCRRMGASLDWSREAFTLDDKRNFAVRTAFKQMYDDGLIYRGHRIVNWDPKGQTVISDDEIVYEERKAKLYTFKYSKDFPIAISTTRPETKVGDVAVAVHPEDERYAEYVGKEYDMVFCGVPIHIKIVADQSVEKDFGTGALGVTPAHSQIDADIAARHKLDTKQVINEYAKMTVGDERLMGKKTTEAREIIAEWLRTEGLMEKEEEITQNVSTAERTGAVIEPLPKLQWFIDVNKPIASRNNKSLKELMLEPVKNGTIKIMPDQFESTYFHWIENLRDWCISRQIWYGHRIPVWYRGDEIYSGVEAPRGEGWTQDEDTLDTWFSSGLWTFSTLGWPEKTPDLAGYHPTTVLETGRDIIFFWVARMILMSQYLLGEVPFKTVYLHGLVRDEKGRKMSKSLGNIVDPLTLIDKYGTDALRMAMIVGVGPGSDSNLGEEKIKAYSKFANKLWNISRFVLENTDGKTHLDAPLDQDDAASIAEFDALLVELTREMDEYKFYLVAEKLYHYVWHTFADILIERSKKKIIDSETSGTLEHAASARRMLSLLMPRILAALHPFMPFITEELWGILGTDTTRTLMVSKWPVVS
jgi:valyl-tRNA synthetase